MAAEKVCVTSLLPLPPPSPGTRVPVQARGERGQSVTKWSTAYSGVKKVSICLKGLTNVMSF